MRLSHADFRPGKRPRFVPSGSPRRKVPLIRIGLLLAAGLFIYTRFDDYWPSLRATLSPSTLWHQAFGGGESPFPGSLQAEWSPDSSRVSLECPRGFTPACCDALLPAGADLCGETRALLAKARWNQTIGNENHPLRLEARAVVSDLGIWGFELAGMGGRDPKGAFHFRRAAGAHSWCDTRRGCLGQSTPRAPLAQGRLLKSREPFTVVWVSGSPQTRAALPGRISAVDSLAEGVRVQVYHGRELYTSYEPLRAAPGVQAGALVRAGSYLGDARRDGAGYWLTVRVRQAGLNRNPAEFWNMPEPDAAASDHMYSGVSQ